MTLFDLKTSEGRTLRQLDFVRLAQNVEKARTEVVVWARVVVDSNAQGPDPKTGRLADYVWRKLVDANDAYRVAVNALEEFKRAYAPKEATDVGQHD